LGYFSFFPFSFHILRHGKEYPKPLFSHSFRVFRHGEKRMRLEYLGDYVVVKARWGKILTSEEEKSEGLLSCWAGKGRAYFQSLQ
jgi:hypothetical protein